jgi:hypothetical protein
MNGKNYQLRPKNKSNNSIDLNSIRSHSNYDEIITNIFQKHKETNEFLNQEREKNNSEY